MSSLDLSESSTTPDCSPATKQDVDLMINERLVMFHRALVDRKQITPPQLNAGPKAITEGAD